MADSPNPKTGATLIAVVERAAAATRSAGSAIASRRGMPLAVAGAFVVALAWVGERDSAWGFPMLVLGGAMIGLGMLGPRLSGSLALRWGEDGAFLQLTSAIAPPGKRRSSPQLQDPVAAAKTGGEAPEGGEPEALIPPSEIEGDAETIDFKVTAGDGTEREPEATPRSD